MIDSIDITIAGEPVPQPRAKTRVLTRRDGSVIRSANGRVATQTYTPGKRIGRWKETLIASMRAVAPREPWDGPIELIVICWFARTKELERAKHPRGEIPHAVKPDLDNLAKAVKDAMTRAGVWVDDSRVCEMTVRKQYVARGYGPGCRVIARLIGPDKESKHGGH